MAVADQQETEQPETLSNTHRAVVSATAALVGAATTYALSKALKRDNTENQHERARPAAPNTDNDEDEPDDEEASEDQAHINDPEDTDDELGVLSRTFNHMSASIQQSRDEQIRSGQIAAVGRLAASIAHDLRNPLSAILGGSEMLAEFDLPMDQWSSSPIGFAQSTRTSLLWG